MSILNSRTRTRRRFPVFKSLLTDNEVANLKVYIPSETNRKEIRDALRSNIRHINYIQFKNGELIVRFKGTPLCQRSLPQGKLTPKKLPKFFDHTKIVINEFNDSEPDVN